MNLFRCSELKTTRISDPTAIQTPLGKVRFSASVGGAVMDGDNLSATYRVAGDGRIIVWESRELDLELLICRPVFSPPLHMPITDCWGALWRGKAKSSSDFPLVLTALWDEGYCWKECGLDCGQYLFAKVWGNADWDVTIGTQDDDMLAIRARNKDYLPQQWLEHFLPSNSGRCGQDSPWLSHPIQSELSREGIACPLPALEEGQEFQIPFGVAWLRADEPDSAVASIAVEASPSQIMAGCGCM